MPRDYSKKKKKLLESLVSNNLLKDRRLYQAFMEVPLEEFIPEKYRDPLKIYEDIPNLFYYQNPQNYRTISAPHMITIMLQGLALKPHDDLLILGAKSGYISALAHKLSPKGEIIILEANSEIAKYTEKSLERLGLEHNITVIVKNPLAGMPDLSPWQKILVTGAIKQSRIHPLLRQLDKDEGVLFAPMGEDMIQTYTQILRIDNDFFGKKQLQVRFTPLMTQVELDEIELITDIDELKEPVQISNNPEKVDEALEKVKIKYTKNIIDEINLDPGEESESFPSELKEKALKGLKRLKNNVKKLKKEHGITNCFKYLERMEATLEDLKDFKKELSIKIKKMKNITNSIRSYNIIRKQLEEKSSQSSLDEQVDIINKQMDELDNLEELINSELKRISRA
jgi:protein-L-isoaspartate(D-aspartate) O-methyltransferase